MYSATVCLSVEQWVVKVKWTMTAIVLEFNPCSFREMM